MLPITSLAALPDRRAIRIADSYLQKVLDGTACLTFDGAMGTMLQREGLAAGDLPELLNLSHPQDITDIHGAYVQAGAQVATTNTFGANARKLAGAASVEDVFKAAISCARASGARYVAADIGPTGALLEPMGALPFDDAYELFSEQMRAAQAHGADLVIIETMTDLLEIKAAVLAAKEHTTLPIFATMTYDETGRTFLGTDPVTATIALTSMGVQALGVNCSLGPDALTPIVQRILGLSPIPVIVQANAGLPSVADGATVYSIGPEDYVAALRPLIEAGVAIVGGCCGTDPSYIKRIAKELHDHVPNARPAELPCAITSAQRSVVLRGKEIAVIGERINPTGKKRLQAALREGNYDYVVGEAIVQTQADADILDVNVGLPEIDEVEVLRALVGRIQAASPLPLQIDSSDPKAIESAARAYAGKPLINSVNGKQESLQSILPIAAHYGCAVVGLTLDENGIPPTAEERLAIAQHIVEAAENAGIARSDVLIDCLVMSASTNQAEVTEILRAVSLVKQQLGVRTVLGVSNVSFGLPARPIVNATFLAAAFAAGLDIPILNPLDHRYREVVDTWRVLCMQDESAQAFIAHYADRPDIHEPSSKYTTSTQMQEPPNGASGTTKAGAPEDELHDLIVAGNKGPVAALVETMLAQTDALEIINTCLVPALDEVGERFEAGTFFLPQLMASAEAAKVGFDVIRERSDTSTQSKGPVVLATVKGDIHDIGKNIVKMLLENYGYQVIDLGRDVDPQIIVDAARKHDCKLVGLSALMTTTVKSMEETIALLREQAPQVKVMVGGAVLTQAYADSIGADFYAKDAAEGARYTGEIL